jgi:capsular exopolysaccharide synthesis family protein
LELREYARAVRRRWRLICAAVALTVAVTAGLTLNAPRTYRSSTVLFVAVTLGDNGPDAKVNRLNSYVALLTGPRIAEAVKAQLRLPSTVQQTQRKITAEVQPTTDLLVVTATDRSAARAASIATAAGDKLIALVRELEPPRADPSVPRPDANAAPVMVAPVTITVAQPAVTTRTPGQLPRNLGFAVVLGLLIGAAGTAVRESVHTTVSSERDLRRFPGLETVGVISLEREARVKGFGRGQHPDKALAEAFRKLRTRLPGQGRPEQAVAPACLLLTSPVPRAGTTATACGLAIALAETGSRVVLVDANLRGPGIGTYLAVDTVKGLADVLAGSATVGDVLCDWGNGRLQVLPAGCPLGDPGELLAAPALADTIRTLTVNFDVVIIDAPPILSVADAAVLTALTSGVLLVVRAGKTRTEQVERSVAILRGVGAPLVGAVLNALPRKLRGEASWGRANQPEPSRQATETAVLPVTSTADTNPERAGLEGERGPARGRASVDITAVSARGRARVVPGFVVPGPVVPGAVVPGPFVPGPREPATAEGEHRPAALEGSKEQKTLE